MKQKSLFLAIAVLLGLRITTTAQTPPAYVPTDGLVGWWPFNGNANDESGNGNNGTVNGAMLTEDRFGACNRAYEFDGVSNFVGVENSSSISVAGSISISAWVLIPMSNELINEQGLVTKWFYSGFNVCNDQEFDSYTLVMTDTDLDGVVNINGSTNVNTVGGNSVFGDAMENDSIWKHVIFTHDSQLGGRLFLNGIQVMSQNTAGDICPSTNPLYFGADNNNGILHRFFNGALDDIGIWNRALTQEEITDLFNANLCYEYITVTDTLIINLGPMGFNPVTYQNTILMYPNPTNDQLTIDYGDFASLAGYTLKIFNSIGQEIHSANISQQQEVLPLGTWGGAGNYQVVIYNVQGVPVDTRTIVLQ
ncbi:MAG: hypothetical protein RL040_385 [Bacteroidota bacterium]